MSTVYPLISGVLLFLAFVGWGHWLWLLLSRLDAGSKSIDPSGLLPGLGISGVILISSGLLWMGFFGKLAIAVLVLGGFLGFLVWLKQKRIAIALLCIGPFVLLKYAWVSVFHRYNGHDDAQAYFVYPQKLLAGINYLADSFSERAFTSGYGGHYLLNAFARLFSSEAFSGVMDPGIAILVLAWVLGAYLLKGKRPVLGLALLGVLVLNLGVVRVNSSDNLLGASLLVSLFVGARDLPLSLRSIRLLCLCLCFAMVTLKSTLIPFVLLGMVFLFWRCPRRYLKPLFGEAILIGSLFLVPWMIQMWIHFGSPLYPVLGRGIHASALRLDWIPSRAVDAGTFPYLVRDLAKVPYFLWCGLLLVILPVLSSLRRTSAAELVFLFIGICGGAATLGIMTGGLYADRFSQGMITAFWLFLFCVSFRNMRESLPRVQSWGVVLLWLGIVIIGTRDLRVGVTARSLRESMAAIRTSGEHKVFQKFVEYRKAYREIFSRIPADATVLVRSSDPFLIPFDRKQIYVSDWPGGISPHPGIPIFSGADAIKQYLLDQGIRYLVYSHHNEGSFRRVIYKGRLSETTHPWIRQMAREALAMGDAIKDWVEHEDSIFQNRHFTLIRIRGG